MTLKPPKAYARWGIQWRSVCRLDGVTSYVMWSAGKPLLFESRAEARAYVDQHYGYIKHRPDLRAEPHGWRTPRPVRVNVTITPT